MTRHVVLALKMFCLSTASLWVVDVVVNLERLELALFRQVALSTVQDYVGLFIAETQLAITAVILGFFVGPLLAAVLKSRSWINEAVPVATAALSAMVILSGLRVAWGFRPGDRNSAFMIAAVAGLVVWAASRLLVGPRDSDRWTLDDIARFVVFLPLFVGMTNQTVANVARGKPGPGLLYSGATVLLLVNWSLLSSKKYRWRRLLTWAPLLAGLLVAGVSVIDSANFGRSHSEIAGAPATDRPSIFLIILDTVRADHLRRYGYHRDTMPQLEQWADTAVVFERAISPAGWTTPAHASILSGEPVSLHGVHYGTDPGEYRTSPVEGIEWLPETLEREGYATLAVSANSIALPSSDGVGFDRVFLPRRRGWYNDTMGALADHISPLMWGISERLRWRMSYADSRQIREIVERVTPDKSQPAFVLVNFLDAHSPYNPQPWALDLLGVDVERSFSRYESDGELTRLWDSLPPSRTRTVVDLYDGELRGLDVELGKLLSWIDQRYEEGAVVVITSDHGEELGEEGRVGHVFGLSQALIHVPLLIKAPGLSPESRDEIVSVRNLHDLISLVASGAEPRLEVITEWDSFGVLSERYPSGHNAKELGKNHMRSWVALFEGKYKAVGPAEHGMEVSDVEVSGFDHPVRAAASTVALPLQARLEEYWAENRDRRESGNDQEGQTEEELERLRALGYVD